MARFYKKRTISFGKKPGEAVYIGNQTINNPYIKWVSFDESHIDMIENLKSISDLSHKAEKRNWFSFHGLSNIPLLTEIKDQYNIPSLVIADLMNTGLRPKLTKWDEGLFLSMKSLKYQKDTTQIQSEQISFILSENSLITFQETESDLFQTIYKRLDQNEGKVRTRDIDYLMYSLMDCIVDQYISVVEVLADEIETLSLEFQNSPSNQTILNANNLNRELLYLGKVINPVRELINRLLNTSSQQIKNSTNPYISDLYSSVIQVSETIEIYKEILSSELDSYSVMLNNKLNEIMKIMAIVSVIFLPMSLITGIYGTNFDFIPELHFKFGYLYLWAVLGTVSTLLILYFKKKKWL